jgi:dipeptidyl aminopeptidase/acylaminoacyl peptidase
MIPRFIRLTRFFVLFLALAVAGPVLASLPAQERPSDQEAHRLTIPLIMKGEEFVGESPSSLQWAFDGSRLYFRWKKPGQKAVELYSLDPAAAGPVKITREEMLRRPPDAAGLEGRGRYRERGFFGQAVEFDKRRTRALVSRNGGLDLVDLRTGGTRTLIRTDEPAARARFTFDDRGVTFQSGENLFLISLADGSLNQLTSVSRRKPEESSKPDDVARWYADQQKALFHEFGQSGRDFSRRGWFRGGAATGSQRKPFILEDNQSLASLELAPDRKSVIFTLSEEVPGVKSTLVPSYVTRSGYTETVTSHPKAAEISWRVKAGILSVETGEVQWLDYGQGDRRVNPDGVSWSPDGGLCLVTAGSEDRKDAWILGLDLATGRTSVIEHVHDEAWVGPLGLIGPVWHPSGSYIYYISEQDGFAHIYRCRPDGRDKTQLTQGRFEVSDLRLSPDGKRLYFHSNEAHPGELHFYVMPSQGGPRTRLTGREGRNEVSLSPDGRYLAVLSSTSNEPPDLFLQANKPGAPLRRITTSTTEEFRSYSWARPEVLSFKARDGVDVFARLFRPRVWRETRPAVIFIHGAGYLQNAHKGWSEYYREYMFHNFLTQEGYLVFDVDYRGSSGYGRDFRTGIYRHMGGKDLDDIVDAARFLVRESGARAGHVGVYGGSYGGFLTLMALFKEGQVIQAGAALRPVTDWAHYHTFYTMDILNLPQDDPEAYKQSSPIYFAEGLQGALLICHGMVDTNVHFQDTVRLVQRLIELGKDNWSVAFYPVEDHTFRTSSAWTDEYKRIFKLFEGNLN